MTPPGDNSQVSYREFFQVQYDSLKADIVGLRIAIKELGSNVATKDDFNVFRGALQERVARIELDAYGLKEALDDLEKVVRSNEREIVIYKRVVAILGGVVVTLFSAWVKGLLGL